MLVYPVLGGTGGQRGGFVNEAGEYLQRCAKSVEAIAAELQPPIKQHFFEQFNIEDLQQLNSQECDRLRLSQETTMRVPLTTEDENLFS